MENLKLVGYIFGCRLLLERPKETSDESWEIIIQETNKYLEKMRNAILKKDAEDLEENIKILLN